MEREREREREKEREIEILKRDYHLKRTAQQT